MRLFPACAPEELFDYGLPFMRMSLSVLGQVHDAVIPQEAPADVKRAAMRAASVTLAGLFSLDLLIAAWFRGVEIVAVFRTPGA